MYTSIHQILSLEQTSLIRQYFPLDTQSLRTSLTEEYRQHTMKYWPSLLQSWKLCSCISTVLGLSQLAQLVRALRSKAGFPQYRESATGSQPRTEPELVRSPHTPALYRTNLTAYSWPGHISLTWCLTITILVKGQTEVCGILGKETHITKFCCAPHPLH